MEEKAGLRLLREQDKGLRVVHTLDEQNVENEVIIARETASRHRH
jgi:hypothetical protein